MPYVDGFVVADAQAQPQGLSPPRPPRPARSGASTAPVDYWECVADDVKVGKVTSFPRSVKLKSGETVLLSWIVFKSRAHRDQVNAKVIADPRLAEMMDGKLAPFDVKAHDLRRLQVAGTPLPP